MGQVIALIPARSGSKGIPGKNTRELGGMPLYEHAIRAAYDANCDRIVLSSDAKILMRRADGYLRHAEYLERPAELASDTAAMVDVVKHAMTQIPGEPDQIWALLQPTAVFRTPARVREAIQLLQSTGADSVVSVVPLPLTHHPMFALGIARGKLDIRGYFPSRRQDVEPAYIRDGTCYTFRRETVTRYGNIYGEDCRPLILEPHETCELDTELQWAEVQARWEREHAR
jgi:CMP-N,N'-diacetyllegionaminic acid synthase